MEYNVTNIQHLSFGRFNIILDTVEKNGHEYPYSFIDVKNSVAVLAKNNVNKFIFIKQYRHTIKDYTLEIPGGAIDEGETPEIAAQRELLEETGYVAINIKCLGTYYPTIGVSNEKCFLFYADCEKKVNPKLEPLEELSTVLLNENEVIDNIVSNNLMHGMALVAWLKWRKMNAYRKT